MHTPKKYLSVLIAFVALAIGAHAQDIPDDFDFDLETVTISPPKYGGIDAGNGGGMVR